MATVIRPEVSSKNEYYIDKHRYYELKHFCLQYNEWKKACLDIDGFAPTSSMAHIGNVASTRTIGDPTARDAIRRHLCARRVDLIEGTALATDPVLHNYILRAVTEELSFTYLKTKLNIPCCRSTYYKIYRKFFWLLNEARD